MKRFTILLTTLVSVLVFSAIFQTWSDARADAKKASVPVKVYDATGAMLEAVNASSSESRIAPVYDATGAMLDAINPNENVTTFPAYDATGAMLEAIDPDKKVITDPAYDATGAMLEAINP
jgi:YD repeat-containing protein